MAGKGNTPEWLRVPERKQNSLPPPVYNPNQVYDENWNRFIRLAKFVAIGGGVGFAFGVVIGVGGGTAIAERSDVLNGVAYGSSMALVGTIAGFFGGAFIEKWTRPDFRQR